MIRRIRPAVRATISTLAELIALALFVAAIALASMAMH